MSSIVLLDDLSPGAVLAVSVLQCPSNNTLRLVGQWGKEWNLVDHARGLFARLLGNVNEHSLVHEAMDGPYLGGDAGCCVRSLGPSEVEKGVNPEEIASTKCRSVRGNHLSRVYNVEPFHLVASFDDLVISTEVIMVM